jgi:hypothetical protein
MLGITPKFLPYDHTRMLAYWCSSGMLSSARASWRLRLMRLVLYASDAPLWHKRLMLLAMPSICHTRIAPPTHHAYMAACKYVDIGMEDGRGGSRRRAHSSF